jgi:uncharacterized protein DUF6314
MDLWRCLGHASRFELTARSELPARWNGSGFGSVVVHAPNPDVRIFTETGAWRYARVGGVAFHNTIRWTRASPGLVRLEHLRFGIHQPVHLVDLEQNGAERWTSVRAHRCLEDSYRAEVVLEEGGFLLRWLIDGPRKKALIEIEYCPERAG